MFVNPDKFQAILLDKQNPDYTDTKLMALMAVVQRSSGKKVFLETLQNSQENSYTRVSFLIKLQVSDLQLY